MSIVGLCEDLPCGNPLSDINIDSFYLAAFLEFERGTFDGGHCSRNAHLLLK